MAISEIIKYIVLYISIHYPGVGINAKRIIEFDPKGNCSRLYSFMVAGTKSLIKKSIDIKRFLFLSRKEANAYTYFTENFIYPKLGEADPGGLGASPQEQDPGMPIRLHDAVGGLSPKSRYAGISAYRWARRPKADVDNG
jgi:hypothetical protein